MLMEDIKKEILQVYSFMDNNVEQTALDGKNTIEILEVSQKIHLLTFIGNRTQNGGSHEILIIRSRIRRRKQAESIRKKGQESREQDEGAKNQRPEIGQRIKKPRKPH